MKSSSKIIVAAVVVMSFLLCESGVPIAMAVDQGSIKCEYKTLFTLAIGDGPGQVGVDLINGAVVPGFMHGPAAFCCDETGNLVVADTLNCRVLFLNLDGRCTATIDLRGITTEAKLASLPIVIDLIWRGPDKLLLADAANNRVLWVNKAGRVIKVYGKPGPGEGEIRQINRIHTDDFGKVYIEDLAQMTTICHDPEGEFLMPYKDCTSVAVDKYGNLHQILFKGDPSSRTVAIYDESATPVETLGIFSSEKDIKYVRPVGFDSTGRFHVSYDTESERYYAAIDTTGKVTRLLLAPGFNDEGVDVTTPDWVAPDGTIFTLKASGRGVEILKLVP